uniref:Uncharacterized protein n=1 Tax=Rhizophagus irregularis (strain DAOM 181602 / DAOM 197198 / MUCL 43194) TaxID=747089 RepID=U9TIL9_RHIID
MELDLKLVAETINCSDSVEFVDPEIMVDLIIVAEPFDYSVSVEFVNPEIMVVKVVYLEVSVGQKLADLVVKQADLVLALLERKSNLSSSSDDRSPFFPSDSETTKSS